MMEGSGLRQRWSKRAPVGILLLLMCVTIPAFTPEDSEEQTCPVGDYLTEGGICCNKCPPGFKLVEKCHAFGQRSNCTFCPPGQFTDEINWANNCRRCRICKTKKNELEVSPCKRHQNTICRCKNGYYKSKVDEESYDCLKCRQCGYNEETNQSCTEKSDTVCVCKKNHQRVKGKCEPCKDCVSISPVPTTGSGSKNEHLINLIAGPIVVGLILAVFNIWVSRKHCTKKKKKTETNFSQLSCVSSDTCQQILIDNKEPWKNSNVTAIAQIPVSEPELPNLPDCVPLEINMSELIYTVLDVVPVPQVKQLVRSLGLKDTEIEQAEMDHRSCKEAHYQMLRVWAERCSQAVGGGRGGLLHRPLLEEVLDKLRQMHLGRAAEELETKYGIH
ncbi:tumor necrosis factor receptor superfamily member 1A [Odontesthes bonariensis]|uniref:tumor necrosis factor receptor superfamily member 1A n=1 Tax=Odontesthes bonariensis TaxID=219752 RepID=UPI003F589385